MHRSLPELLFFVLLMGLLFFPVPACQAEVEDVKLEFTAPNEVMAYDYLPIDIKLTGKGDVSVQAVATDSEAYTKYFDSAIPHEIAFQFEYLSEEDDRATFRITNVGDTIWKAGGYGVTNLAAAEAPYTYLSSDLAPGESITKTYPVRALRVEGGKDVERIFVMTVRRSDSSRTRGEQPRLELKLPSNRPGQTETVRRTFTSVPLHDTFDEFGQAFIRRQIEGGALTEQLKVQVPPWADRLVVRLIKDGKIKISSLPLKVSQESLKLGGTPNKRWTLDGKPVFVMTNVTPEEMPEIRKQLGTANVVLNFDGIPKPNDRWLKAVREHGFKITPNTVAYVRLQMIGQWTGQKLMEGAPPEFNIYRVDAMDPNFHNAMADVVDRIVENCGDLLYRTADGKLPIGLSTEQSYGFPFSSFHPTRWGGSTPQNVAAFRVWLKEKYGDIDALNAKWKTEFESFEGIDPSPLGSIHPPTYPDPWKEWGPAIEDFDLFRSKIHGEFWARTVAEIKKRHPEAICGMNWYATFASEEEPIYNGFYQWGVKDYQGKVINWMARRTGSLPQDMDCFDYVICWNSGPAEAAKKHLDFWRDRGQEMMIFARDYAKVILGGDQELRTHSDLDLGIKGKMIFSHRTAYFPPLKATYENGGIPGLLNDAYIGNRVNEFQRREVEIFNKAISQAVTASP